MINIGHILAHAIKPLTSILSAGSIMATLAGCSDTPDTPETPLERDPCIYLTLDVKVLENNLPMTSRADNDYTFEEPLAQNEKLNFLDVIIVDKTTDKVEHHRAVEYDANGKILHSDNLTFRVKPGMKSIYLFGNYQSLCEKSMEAIKSCSEGSYFDASTLTALTESRSSGQPFYAPGQDIPMTESFDIDVLQLEEDGTNLFQSKSLFVTRLATKFTIRLKKSYLEYNEAPDISITSIGLSQYTLPYETDYTPAKDRPGEIIDNIGQGHDITTYTTPTNASETFTWTLTNKNEKTINVGSDNEETVYEYDPVYLTESPASKFQLGMLIKDYKDEYSDGFYTGLKTLENLRLQSGTGLYLLPRNTHVIVTISMTPEISFSVDLVPYGKCVLEPEFGVDPDKLPNI